VEKLAGKRPLGRVRACGRINIKMHLKEIGWEGLIVVKMRKNGGLL
jgi:hypothetical protein